MADLIDFETGVGAFTYAPGRPAWHRIGEEMTPEEQINIQAAMAKSRTDFGVAKRELFYWDDQKQAVEVPDAAGIYRTDTGKYLSTVGDGYHPIQNQEAFSIAQPLIDLGCKIDVMGSIKEGRKVWALMSMPNATIDVFGDMVNGYMLIKSAHDASMALTAAATGTRVVCNNTMELYEASPKYSVISIRHSKSAPEQITMAKTIMSTMYKAMEQAGETFRSLAEKEMDKNQIKDLLIKMFPQPEGRESDTVNDRRIAVADLIFNGTGNKPWAEMSSGRATAWAVLNGFTEYFDHERVKEAQKLSAKSSAVVAATFGQNNAIKNRVMKMLIAA